MLLMMSENIARNMQSSQGIINYPTRLHLVGHIFTLYHNARKHEYQVNAITLKANKGYSLLSRELS
jgi:hypothetical protein